MNVTIYFRKAVWEKLQDEPDRSALVNRLLEKHYGGFSEEPVIPTQQFVPLPQSEVFVPRPPDPVTVYPCCLKKNPCKHWPWNSDAGAYVNTLTGEVREVAF